MLQGGNGEPIYTRDGNFSLDANGTLVDPSSGLDVMVINSAGARRAAPDSSGRPKHHDRSQRCRLRRLCRRTNDVTRNRRARDIPQCRRSAARQRRISSHCCKRRRASRSRRYGGLRNTRLGNAESSNVDLAGEFVKMIAAKTAFDANAKSVEVASSTLKTIVDLPD